MPDQQTQSQAPDVQPDAALQGSFGERLRKVAVEAGTLGYDVAAHVGTQTVEQFSAAGRQSLEMTRQASTVIQNSVTGMQTGAHYLAQSLLYVLGSDPKSEQTAIDLIQRVTPVLGAIKSYADGWKMYHQAISTNDPELLSRARVQGIVAFGEAGIDATAFGIGRLVVKGKLLGSLLQFVATARSLDAVDTNRVQALEGLAKQVLRIPGSTGFIDSLFQSIKPAGTPESDPPKQQ